jgi:PEP-CTERM motif
MNRKNLFVFNAKKIAPLSAALLLACALSSPLHVEASIVNLADGNSQAQIDLDSVAGMNYWSVDGQNQLVKQWFWYRTGSGVAVPINTISPASFSNTGNELIATYANGQFSLQVHYLLTGGGAGSGTADIQESISIHNFTGSPLDFHFYQYSDFDLLGTGGDSIIVDNDFAVQTKGPTQIAEAVNQPSASHFEGAYFNTTLNALNTTVDLVLSDVGSAGPGNVTWALQWDSSIGSGMDFDIFKDKLLSIAPIPEPSALALISLGLVGYGAWTLPRRRQKV